MNDDLAGGAHSDEVYDHLDHAPGPDSDVDLGRSGGGRVVSFGRAAAGRRRPDLAAAHPPSDGGLINTARDPAGSATDPAGLVDAEDSAGYAALEELVDGCLDLGRGFAAVWDVGAAGLAGRVARQRQPSMTGDATPIAAAPAPSPAASPDRSRASVTALQVTTAAYAPLAGGGAGVDRASAAGIILGTQLQRLREAVGLSRARAGDAVGMSALRISLLELGRAGVARHDLEALLALYGVLGQRERAALLELGSRENAEAGQWWQRENDLLPRGMEVYLQLEGHASHIRAYQLRIVPDLLQSPDYTRQLSINAHKADPADVPAADIDRRVELVAARQRPLTEPNGPRYWAVVDEGALRRPIGSPAILRSQLRHILDMTERPNVTVQMLPFTARGQAEAAGAFTVLRFTEPDLPDVIHVEHLNSGFYLDKPTEVDKYRGAINHASVQARNPDETRSDIRKLIKSL